MKKISLSLLLFLIGSMSYSQIVPSVDVRQRKEYIMKTYKVDSRKAERYEEVLSALQQENELLKSQKITSSQFIIEQKKLYKKFGIKISELFYDGKYKTWSYCNQELERYQVLSDNRFIPYDKMRALYQLEVEGAKARELVLKRDAEEWQKYEDIDAMVLNLNNEICQLIGAENGTWYLTYKNLIIKAFENMDKYKTSYKDAVIIARIEDTYKQKRANILKTRKKYSEKEIELMANDDEMEKKVIASVPSVSVLWKKVNHALLDYDLNTKFGLNQSQIAQFKKDYNKYTIEEYKILDFKKISETEKYNQLSQLSENFCITVRPLFKNDKYNKWSGWWQYSFERKMKRKGLK